MNDSRPTERSGRPRQAKKSALLAIFSMLPARCSAMFRRLRGCSVRANGAGGSPRLQRGRTRAARPRRLGLPRRPQAGRAENPLHSPPASAGDRLKSISVIEVVNDDMPFLVDSLMGELTERGIGVRLVAHPIFSVDARQRRQAHRAAGRSPRRRQGRRRTTRASSTSMSSASTTRRSARRSRTRSKGCWPTSASACATGSRWWRASTR